MKIAALHNGKQIGFPDDADDAHMDAAVQAYHAAANGPQQPDPGFEMLQQGLQAMGQLMQLVHHLTSQVAQMQQQSEDLGHQLAEMRQHDEHANNQIIAALTAPKSIVHDKDGRPVGVTVGN